MPVVTTYRYRNIFETALHQQGEEFGKRFRFFKEVCLVGCVYPSQCKKDRDATVNIMIDFMKNGWFLLMQSRVNFVID